ncbi:MAG: hypothetical protein CFH42_00030 [Alphaproteobacteria bacterium MarineAlpha12_Bin1]|jgi:hypothetical protein|nr:MAG: hypothetical protein CFH42_00030 [Alphaproteobacteria bacterium MarineAlpha12_Bin1]|tara:strand:+ start:1477 stop:2019 length:543 start_codon:yes stop_codon:yes gene_type:complete
MMRLKIINRKNMTDEQGKIFDEAQENGWPVGGPFWAYIRIPELMRQSLKLRECLQEGPLSGRERQIINLVVARHWNAKYPWFAQVRGALIVGLEEKIIQSINQNLQPEFESLREKTVYELAKEMLENQSISDKSFNIAEECLGLNDLIAAVALIGQFGMTCCTANAFKILPPEENIIPLL